MMELLMNEHPALCGPNGKIIYPLMTFVQPAAPGAYERVMSKLDPSAAWPEAVVGDVVKLALSCVGHPDRRPLFESVVQELRTKVQAVPQVTLPTPLRNRSSGSVGQPSPAAHQQTLPANRVQAAGYAGGQHLPPPPPRGNDASLSPQAGAAAVAAPPAAPRRSQNGPEIMLECTYAEGVDLAAMPQNLRATTIQTGSNNSGSSSVGRQHQIELFDRLVPNRERLTAISRVHFEIMWDQSAANSVRLKKVSGNPLLLDSRLMASNEIAPLSDGMSIGFRRMGEEKSFLEMRVNVRGNGSPRPRTPPSPLAREPVAANISLVQAPKANGRLSAGTVAVLECTSAMGIDISNLSKEEKFIELPLSSPIEIGKQKQPEFFRRLLQEEPTWLSFLSRTHCRVHLSRRTLPSKSLCLNIENVSSNVIVVSNKKVAKGNSECIEEGGTFAFVAAPEGSAEIKFLEFVLRGV